MKKILISLLFAANFVVACTVPTSQTTPTNGQETQNDLITITGVVQDQLEQVVVDANITVKDNNKVIGTTKTDSHGTFSIKVPKTFDGSYYIEATKQLSDGSLSQSIIITAGQQANFTGNDKLVKNTVAANPVPVQ